MLPFLQEKCNQRLATKPGRMEMGVFASASLADYPSLFVQNGVDLMKQTGLRFFLGLGLGLVMKSVLDINFAESMLMTTAKAPGLGAQNNLDNLEYRQLIKGVTYSLKIIFSFAS
jgi:hypothetical protein